MRVASFPVTLFFTIALLACVRAHSETLSGTVVGLADGDTITVLDSSKVRHRIRLAGIDAPEKQQAFGSRSQQSLSELVFKKSVQVDFTKRDRYGRIIGKVLVNNSDVSLEQIKRGMAWHYKAYEREQTEVDRELYAQAERDARQVRRGLWRDSSPIPPWEFRKIR